MPDGVLEREYVSSFLHLKVLSQPLGPEGWPRGCSVLEAWRIRECGVCLFSKAPEVVVALTILIETGGTLFLAFLRHLDLYLLNQLKNLT